MVIALVVTLVVALVLTLMVTLFVTLVLPENSKRSGSLPYACAAAPARYFSRILEPVLGGKRSHQGIAVVASFDDRREMLLEPLGVPQQILYSTGMRGRSDT